MVHFFPITITKALKIIYGWNIDIDQLMQIKGIETLRERRENAVLNFALRNENVGKYGKRWFEEEGRNNEHHLRSTRDKYRIPVGRTNRTKANPVTSMAIRLNEHYRS